MMKQVRKALDDIRKTISELSFSKAAYEIDMLRKMIDEQPSRQKPWSYYQEQVKEEFDA